jgi:hypothetical protein
MNGVAVDFIEAASVVARVRLLRVAVGESPRVDQCVSSVGLLACLEEVLFVERG